jgi:hypothetical protein
MKTQLKLELNGGNVEIRLYQQQKKILKQAADIGHALAKMHQPTGPPLVDAITAILGGPVAESEEDDG